MSEMECPIWVREEAFIQQLLSKLLDSVETGKIPRTCLREGGWAQPLFDHQNNNGARLFSRIELLAAEPISMLRIQQPPADANLHDTPYRGAWVYLNLEKAPLLRHWLGRTKVNEERMALQDALFSVAGRFADRGRALLQARLTVPGRTEQEIVDAFVAIRDLLPNVYTLRELSASCFWGDSKFLDDKTELLQRLYPEALRYLRERPQFLQVFLPEVVKGILIIENQDTFMRACLQQLAGAENLVAVFGAGFKAASSASRQRDKVRFFFSGAPTAELLSSFESAWFDDTADLPRFFFGDLDWSGMGILSALRQQFPDLQAWPPGYEPLRHYIEQGGGHMPQQAKKSQQLFVAATGCTYADKVLLPTLIRHSRFADQELQFDA